MSGTEIMLLIAIIAVVALIAFVFYEIQVQKGLWEEYQNQLRCQGLGWFGCVFESIGKVFTQNKEVASFGVGGATTVACLVLALPAHIASFGATAGLCGIAGLVTGGVGYGLLGGTPASLIVSIVGGFAIPILSGVILGTAFLIWSASILGVWTPANKYIFLLTFFVGFAVGLYIGQIIVDILPYIAVATIVAVVIALLLRYKHK